MFSIVSFAVETNENFTNFAKNQNNVEKQNLFNLNESSVLILGCSTTTYTHTRVVGTRPVISMDDSVSVVEVTSEVYTSGACTTCSGMGSSGVSYTVDCWGSRFPPLNW